MKIDKSFFQFCLNFQLNLCLSTSDLVLGMVKKTNKTHQFYNFPQIEAPRIVVLKSKSFKDTQSKGDSSHFFFINRTTVSNRGFDKRIFKKVKQPLEVVLVYNFA